MRDAWTDRMKRAIWFILILASIAVASGAMAYFLLRLPLPDQDDPTIRAVKDAVARYEEHVDEDSALLCNLNVLRIEPPTPRPSIAYIALDCEHFERNGDVVRLWGGGQDVAVYLLQRSARGFEVVARQRPSDGNGFPADVRELFPADLASRIVKADDSLQPGFDGLQERAEGLLLG